MKTLIFILLLFLPQQELEYKWGKPTSKGVDNYIQRNEHQFIIEYQNYVNDTLFLEPYISTDDLSKYYHYERGESGWFEYPDNIIIDNETKYLDYELKLLTEFEKSGYVETNMFVKAVVMHELTHCYIHQNILITEQNNKLHHDYQQGLRMMPNDNWFTEFIEEGFCEFVVLDMQEMIGSDVKHEINRFDLTTGNRNSYEIKYVYSREFVKPVVMKYGLKQAIQLVVSHAAPTSDEILNPNLYYSRLNTIY